jgi:hypothetical protein
LPDGNKHMGGNPLPIMRRLTVTFQGSIVIMIEEMATTKESIVIMTK